MATIQLNVTIEANEQELGQLAGLLLGRLLGGVEQQTTTMVEPLIIPQQVTRKKPAPAKRPALIKEQIEKAVASDKVAGEEPKRAYSGDRLPFDELDALVRTEMKRLSIDKRMPGSRLWDEERDNRLPTLGAIMHRYKKTRLADLAEVFGLQPPLSTSTNAISSADR